MSTPKLAAKMVLAMKAIDAVAKNGNNKFQNYKYVQAADVAHEVRKALIDNGISFDYSVTDTDRWDRTNGKGNVESCVQVKVAVTFTDQDSGEARTVNSIGWGMDSLDKAPYKAMTGAVKYALRMNFLIPDDADPENDANAQGPVQAKAQVQPINQQLKDSIAEDDDLAFLNQENPAVDYKFSEDSYRKAYSDTPAPPVKAAHSVGAVKAISPKQVSRLWSIAKSKGVAEEAVMRIVKAAGYDEAEAIGWKSYDGIISQIEGQA